MSARVFGGGGGGGGGLGLRMSCLESLPSSGIPSRRIRTRL